MDMGKLLAKICKLLWCSTVASYVHINLLGDRFSILREYFSKISA